MRRRAEGEMARNACGKLLIDGGPQADAELLGEARKFHWYGCKLKA